MNSILLYNLCEKYDKEVLMKKERYVGICTVGEKVQIVIPKAVREMFNINLETLLLRCVIRIKE